MAGAAAAAPAAEVQPPGEDVSRALALHLRYDRPITVADGAGDNYVAADTIRSAGGLLAHV